MAEDLEWMDPPPQPPRVYGRTAQVQKLLQANPGKWARISRDNKSTSCTGPYKKLGLQTVAHRTNPQEKPPKYDLYVRYVPKGEPRPKGLSDAYKAMGAAPAPAAKPTPGAYTPAGRAARGVPDTGLPLRTLGGRHP